MKPKLSVILVLGAAVLAAGIGVSKLRERKGSGRALVSDAKPRQAEVLEAAETLYDGKLGAGWDDWGWGPHDLGKGPAKVVFTNFGGILLQHAELTGAYAGLAFRYKAPAGWPDFLQVSLRGSGVPDTAFPTVAVELRHVAVLPDEWREVLIDLKELNPESHPFDRVMISSQGSVGSDWVLLDRIILTKAAGGAAMPAGARSVALRVDCAGPSRRISELIYGGSSDEWSTGQSAQRMGGNPLSRANWELGAWNTGKDWYFENVGNKRTMFESLAASAEEKRKIALVVPMIGWVAKDKTSSGFPRASFGDQAQFDPYRREAGNGIRADGSVVEPGPPTQTSLSAPPELIEQWVRKLAAADAARGSRSVAMYILDNEPSLWNITHRDVHPRPLSYEQLLERTIAYASAIRRADPGALIAGPAEWGWLGYQKSAVDREAGRNGEPDRKAHGDVALVAWYLRKLAEYEKATGTRLLDVFDLHFYPAADGVYSNAKTDTATSELRLRSTRALWDPTYRDESWIAEAIQLIPRMQAWVKENYPGRQLMIGEWSFGADADISGGLAAAEAFGRFGQHDLDAAFFWGQPKPDSAIYWAFRAFRDFDGKGARFQDFSLTVTEGQKVSLFASRNEARDRIVLVLLNREPLAKVTAKISLAACGGVVSTRLFSYGAKSKALDPGTAETSDGAVAVTLEPFSVAVLDLELKLN